MLGAVVGDIIGSTYEFHNTKSMGFELFEEVILTPLGLWLEPLQLVCIPYLRRLLNDVIISSLRI